MNWEKLGRVYCPDGQRDWARTHAFLPTPIRLKDGTIRIYVAFLDDESTGRIGYVDVSSQDPKEIISVSDKPVLDVGREGTFDCAGVNPSAAVKTDEGIYLYYVGWQLGQQVRYFLFTGLAVSTDDGESFERVSETPILDRTDGEIYTRTGCYVMPYRNGYRMWYAGGDRWIRDGEKDLPAYQLRVVSSEDGINWDEENKVCLHPQGDEFGFGRPAILHEKGSYRMWYSIRYRNKGYRIGFAESTNGIDWDRMDHLAGIDISDQGWDSEMVCFPAIVDANGERYMFYNGNDYGRSGFGVARVESP